MTRGTGLTISLPDESGRMSDHVLTGTPVEAVPVPADAARTVIAAAHVVADPFTGSDPDGPAVVDWEATLAFRRHLAGLGLGIAEAMDTAQRGMGLDWGGALELITRTRRELPDALVFNGAGTDHLQTGSAQSLDDIVRAYMLQIDAIQGIGGRIIIMASRELCRVARGADDYAYVYGKILAGCDQPVILHWLGEMFDPALEGYWGTMKFDEALACTLDIIGENSAKVDGIKLSLLDEAKEIAMRRRLPPGARMYTGDDFNYPELIAGDEHGHSDALLGIFDPVAPAAATAVARLTSGDLDGFHGLLDPTVPLSREIFRSPTRHYKSGVVFLAWLNGHQDHFVMLGGSQAMRPLPYFCSVFRHADACGLLMDPEMAVDRMNRLLALYGVR